MSQSTQVVEGRRERKKRETRERVLKVSRELFTLQGFDATTVEAIAEEADISKPTLFNYFPSKLAILQALVPEVDQRFAAVVEQQRAEGGTITRQLTGFFGYVASMTHKTPLLTRSLLVEALKAYGDPSTTPSHHRFNMTHKSLLAILEEGVTRGEVRADTTPERLAHHITGVYIYGLLSWLQDPNYSVETELAEAAKLLGSALKIKNSE